MTSDELKQHLLKMKSGGVRIRSAQEVEDHLFARWGELLRRLAESERKDMAEAAGEPVMARSCPSCGTLRPHHVGCPHV